MSKTVKGKYGGKCVDCGLILMVDEVKCTRCGFVFESPAEFVPVPKPVKPVKKV